MGEVDGGGLGGAWEQVWPRQIQISSDGNAINAMALVLGIMGHDGLRHADYGNLQGMDGQDGGCKPREVMRG